LKILRVSGCCPDQGALWVVGLPHALLDVRLSPGSSSRVPLPVRPSAPRRDRACEPPHLRSSPEPYRSPWPIPRPSLLGSVRTSRPRDQEMRLSPLHRPARAASTPATTASRRFGLEGATPEVPFRPRGFSPPRRLPPLHESRACCIPLPILGSTAFPLWSARPEGWVALSFPRDAGPYPSKDSSPTAGARHRARCPLAVPCPITASPRLSPLPVAGLTKWEDRERRLRGLAPSFESGAAARRCR